MPKSIHSPDYTRLKRLLRDIRLEKGLTQAELGNRLAVSQSRISKVELGERRLDLVELQDWCRALGISLTTFVGRFQSISRRNQIIRSVDSVNTAQGRCRAQAVAGCGAAELLVCDKRQLRMRRVLDNGNRDAPAAAPGVDLSNVFVPHGHLQRRERVARIAGLKALPDAALRVVLATGKLVGDGFDRTPPDTLPLALPISWKGTLPQYAVRMWRRRLAGFRFMRYVLATDDEDLLLSQTSDQATPITLSL